MYKVVLSLIITSIFISLEGSAYSQNMEDVVYLKNGSIIHGTIIEQIPNESIKIKTKDGNIFVYKIDEIEKMTREEIIEKNGPKETPSTLKLKKGSNYSSSGFGIRFGIGTDITLGLGFGTGVFYVASSPYSSPDWDLGLDIYYANVSEEETDYEGTRREANTKVIVFALRSNALFNYYPKKTGVYFVAGAGFVITSVDWEETYTYYPPYAPHTEHWSDDGIAFGNVFNLGVGLTFGGGLEARLETPLLIFYDTPGKASGIAPTFTLNVLYRFP